MPANTMLSYSALLLLAIARLCHGRCECGYSVKDPNNDGNTFMFTDIMETDFSKLASFEANREWARQEYNVSAEDGRGEYGKMFDTDNAWFRREGEEEGYYGYEVRSYDAGVSLYNPPPKQIELAVHSKPVDGYIKGAEIASTRQDMQWGSYRAGIWSTNTTGTCAAFFWYFNDTQEIDIEFLSREFVHEDNHYPINLVIQSKEAKEAGYDASESEMYQKPILSFNPGNDYHEYRFDYVPGKVFFYVDDVFITEMKGDAVPSAGGHLHLSHWSNGNQLWSGGPPEKTAYMTISYIKAYFNSSDTEEALETTEECNQAMLQGKQDAICPIPDTKPGTAKLSSYFFLAGDEEGSNDEEKEEGKESYDDKKMVPTSGGDLDINDSNGAADDEATPLRLGQPIALVMALVGAMYLVQT